MRSRQVGRSIDIKIWTRAAPMFQPELLGLGLWTWRVPPMVPSSVCVHGMNSVERPFLSNRLISISNTLSSKERSFLFSKSVIHGNCKRFNGNEVPFGDLCIANLQLGPTSPLVFKLLVCLWRFLSLRAPFFRIVCGKLLQFLTHCAYQWVVKNFLRI